ncbi:MAG: hypothetical protein OEV28_09705 [Nitrospirota bacterium]|nr:hypothetical protein [Nitrospirota bacterium]
MINLIIATLVGIVTYVVLHLLDSHWVLNITLFVIAAVAANYFLTKRVMNKINELIEQAQKPLTQNNVEKAISIMKQGYAYNKWQFFVEAQLNGQIGTIYYIAKDFANAYPYLEKSFSKHWIAQAMLAILHMKRKEVDKMKAIFEKTVKGSAKESLLWNVYAWCLLKQGDREGAINVLSRGAEKCPGDERLKTNLLNLQNKKEMKMKPYGEMWYQFHLERMEMRQPQHPGQMAGMRGRRAMRR